MIRPKDDAGGVRWIVVGGGFRGIVTADLLRARGNKVVLVERAQDLGGVLVSRQWNGFWLDNGCHLFANDDDESTAVTLTILGDAAAPVAVRYASVTNGVKTDGTAIPDLAAYGPEYAQRIQTELTGAGDDGACRNLRERFDVRFGRTAGALVDSAFHKVYRIESSKVEADALRLTPFRRIQFLEANKARALKGLSSALDQRVAAPSQDDPMRYSGATKQGYPHRNFYPIGRGMRTFGELAAARLKSVGVDLQLGVGIAGLKEHSSGVELKLADGRVLEADHVAWTATTDAFARLQGMHDAISPYTHRLAMVLYYFAIPKDAEGPYTYVHDFDRDHRVYRASVPGSYALDACPPGQSYVCAEVPTSLESPEWDDPDALRDVIWDEVRALGVAQGIPIDACHAKVAGAIVLPLIGYSEALRKALAQFEGSEKTVGLFESDYGKTNIIRSVRETINHVR